MAIDTVFILSPLTGAVIGYFTNWLAIKMLFRPYTEKYAFGVRLPFTPGLIPKRRGVLAKKVAQTIIENLLTDDVLLESITGGEVKRNIGLLLDGFIDDIKSSDTTLGELLSFSGGGISRRIAENGGELAEWLAKATESEFFEESLKPLIIELIKQNVRGFASLFVVPESLYQSLRENLAESLRNPVNHVLIGEKLAGFYDILSVSVKLGDVSSKIDDSYFETLKGLLMSKYDEAVMSNFPRVFGALNLAGIIESRINAFEMSEAEEIIVGVVDRELKAITYLGGLLGFVIGLVLPLFQSLGGF